MVLHHTRLLKTQLSPASLQCSVSYRKWCLTNSVIICVNKNVFICVLSFKQYTHKVRPMQNIAVAPQWMGCLCTTGAGIVTCRKYGDFTLLSNMWTVDIWLSRLHQVSFVIAGSAASPQRRAHTHNTHTHAHNTHIVISVLSFLTEVVRNLG